MPYVLPKPLSRKVLLLAVDALFFMLVKPLAPSKEQTASNNWASKLSRKQSLCLARLFQTTLVSKASQLLKRCLQAPIPVLVSMQTRDNLLT